MSLRPSVTKALFYLALSITSVHAAEGKNSLSARIEKFAPKAEDFFFAPKTELDKTLYQTGLLHHWQMYGKTPAVQAEKFKGYILFADPYHRGLKRISFLLGTDCSNFVHRFMQMIGADFQFLKTRQWIHLAQALKSGDAEAYFKKQNASHTPIDLKFCVWKSVTSSFKLIEGEKNLEVGDIVVYPKSEGILGLTGHMGFVAAVKPAPLILQAKYPQGITTLPLEKGDRAFIRYTGELKSSIPGTLSEALSKTYSENTDVNANCSSEEGTE